MIPKSRYNVGDEVYVRIEEAGNPPHFEAIVGGVEWDTDTSTHDYTVVEHPYKGGIWSDGYTEEWLSPRGDTAPASPFLQRAAELEEFIQRGIEEHGDTVTRFDPPLAATLRQPSSVPQNCPNCHSSALSWHADVQNTGTVVDGRLRLNEITPILYLGCNECSETISCLRGGEIEALVNRSMQHPKNPNNENTQE